MVPYYDVVIRCFTDGLCVTVLHEGLNLNLYETKMFHKRCRGMKHSYPRPIVAYLRVSTEKQDLESQWMTIGAWAKSKNITIDERIIEEEPVSGAEDNRPKF